MHFIKNMLIGIVCMSIPYTSYAWTPFVPDPTPIEKFLSRFNGILSRIILGISVLITILSIFYLIKLFTVRGDALKYQSIKKKLLYSLFILGSGLLIWFIFSIIIWFVNIIAFDIERLAKLLIEFTSNLLIIILFIYGLYKLYYGNTMIGASLKICGIIILLNILYIGITFFIPYYQKYQCENKQALIYTGEFIISGGFGGGGITIGEKSYKLEDTLGLYSIRQKSQSGNPTTKKNYPNEGDHLFGTGTIKYKFEKPYYAREYTCKGYFVLEALSDGNTSSPSTLDTSSHSGSNIDSMVSGSDTDIHDSRSNLMNTLRTIPVK